MSSRASARERILDAAADLFYAQGVAATGIDAITAHAGVAKMSLYNNFSSKAELVNDYLRRRVEEWHQNLYERLLRASTAEERVLAVFDSYVDHAERAYSWGFRGCGLLNAAAELAVGDLGRSIVAEQKDEVERLFAEHLHALRSDAGAAIDETAQHLSYLLEGAMARAGLEGHGSRLKSVRAIALSVVRQFAAANRPAASAAP